MTGGCVKMIISNEKKFIYLRVPKTGSTSVSVFLYENVPLEKDIIRISDTGEILKQEESCNIKNGYFDDTYTLPGGVHATLDQIVTAGFLKYPLNEYKIYAVCRNPIDRFLSFYNMMQKVDGVDMLKSYSIFKEYMSMFEASPQSTWLMHEKTLINNIFLYEDVHKLVSEIAKKYNILDTSVFYNYRFREYKKQTTSINPKALEYIKIYWQEDFKIYNLLRSKKLANLKIS